jgi:anti-sigma factor RsiW
MNCHEAIDLMGDAVDGCVPSTFRAGFDEHMAECDSCRTYLEHLRLTRQALRALPRGSGTSSHLGELIKKFTKEFDRNRD